MPENTYQISPSGAALTPRSLYRFWKRSLYEDFENLARARVLTRDPDDWPIVAVALLLDFPIWTEDQDFFGSGVATWTTDRVELYLR